jgi:DNA-binding SARP family transcriptional activator/tetratricopeptide (TPR) repeat protein
MPLGPGAQPIRFRLLGEVTAESAAGPVDIGGPTAKAILALLLMRGEAGLSTDEIIAAVWDGPGGATRDSVYHYLSALRKALAATDAVLHTRRPRYRLTVEADTVDWHRFRRLAGAARAAREGQEPDRAAALFRAALALWSGPALADVGDRLAPYRRDMTDQRRAVIETLAEVEAERGNPDEVLALLGGEFSTGPVRERAAALTIDALASLGRRDDAGEFYRLTRARLVDEQGLEPGAPLEAAHRRALDGAGPVSVTATDGPISGLPRLNPHFTGRSSELRAITEALTGGNGPMLCGIYGMGGSGKTTLAVQAAHAVADAFPDGVIFLDLYGYTEIRAALTAAEALDRLLRRMGVNGAAIPADADERAALYRHLLARRRILVVLDNAHATAQIGPLLPDARGCGVLVTSRRRLAELDDALAVPLDVLARDEAVELFRSVAGRDRLPGEPRTERLLAHVADLCGRLPLAVRIAAGRYRIRETASLENLAERLADEDVRLAELDDDDRSVAASLRVSLRDLSPPLARMFALLTVAPGSNFDALAAAALADVPPGDAARQLERLADRHLIAEQAPGRYGFHDLIGVFARRYALEPAAASDRAAGLRRLADYFLRAVEAADRLITPYRYRVPADLLDRVTVLPPLGDYDAAFAWLRQEQGNLADMCLAAGAAGFDAACWQLAYALRGYYYLTKSWQPWIATHEAALAAARRCGDVRAEALIVNNLGLAHLERGMPDLAAGHYRRARALFAEARDPHGENTARANLAWLMFSAGSYAEFLAEMRPVLAFYREHNADRNAAITLRGMGLAEARLGLIARSIADLRQALDVFVRLELRLDIAMTWNGLGEAYQQAGDGELATAAFTQGLAASEQSGSEFEQARAHHRLGQLAAGSGDRGSAWKHWAWAMARYRRLGVPQAADVQRELDALSGYR